MYNTSRLAVISVHYQHTLLILAAPNSGGTNQLAQILLIATALAFGCVLTLLWSEWAKSILNRYLEDRNWRLLSARFCWLARGPYTWTTSKNQVVFRIEVQDRHGEVHRGYARIGTYWLGLLDPKVDIHWTDSLGPASF